MSASTVVYWQGLDDLPPDGGGLRVRAWVDALTRLGHDVEVAGLRSSAATQGERHRLVETVHTAKRHLAPLPARRDHHPARRADLTVVAVPAAVPSTLALPGPVVVDWMDLWSEVAASWATAGPAPGRAGARVQQRLWTRREDRAFAEPRVAHATAGWTDAMTARARGARGVAWLPTPVPAAAQHLPPRPARALRRVGMIANFAHPPNATAWRRFLERWGPTLRARRVEAVVAGIGSDALPAPDGVRRLGPVPSPAAFYDAVDAAVVPVDLGGGIKVKAVEALAHGVPVFGTDHVRAGFGPAWRDAVRPLAPGWLDATVPGAAVDLTPFTPDGFLAGVRAVLDHQEVPT